MRTTNIRVRVSKRDPVMERVPTVLRTTLSSVGAEFTPSFQMQTSPLVMSSKYSFSQTPAHFARVVEMLGTEMLERLRAMFDIY